MEKLNIKKENLIDKFFYLQNDLGILDLRENEGPMYSYHWYKTKQYKANQ